MEVRCMNTIIVDSIEDMEQKSALYYTAIAGEMIHIMGSPPGKVYSTGNWIWTGNSD